MLIGGVLTLLGLLVAVGALVVLHVLATTLSPVRDAVSHYGITRYASGYRALTIAMAVSGLGGLIGVAVCLRGDALIVVLALAVFVASRAVISWFPMDGPGQLVTPRGAYHLLLAILAFAAILVAAARLGTVLDRTDSWPDWRGASLPLTVLLAVGMVALVVTRRALPGYFGAGERLYYVGMFAWLGWLGLALIANS